jgi:hypothetical protein
LSFAGKWTELENILSEVSQAQETKGGHASSHMWNTDLTQIQLCYEKQVTLRAGHIPEREVKEGS